MALLFRTRQGGKDGGTIQRVIKPNSLLQPALADMDGGSGTDSAADDGSDGSTPVNAQVKANRIIQQAIDKANKEGRNIPKVIQVPGA